VLRDDVTAPGSVLLLMKSRCACPWGRCKVQGHLPSWCEPTRLARCAWGANWTVLMRCAADSTLSEQQRRQFSAAAARAEWRFSPQPRRKSCNGL